MNLWSAGRCFVTILFLLPQTSLPQDRAPVITQSDPQAVQLLSNAFLSIGGGHRAGIADVRIEGTLRSPSVPDEVIGTFTAKARGGDWSVETTIGTHTSKYRVLNGAGTLDDGSSAKNFHPAITAGSRLDIFPLFHRWTEFDQPGSVATIMGTTMLDGAAYTQIHVHSGVTELHPGMHNQHGETDILVDASTGTIAAIRYKAMLGMPKPKEIEVENRFVQYERLGGLLVPTKVTKYLAGKALVIYHVDRVQSNNGFTDGDFQNHGGNAQ